jgi:5-methylcytosine-specific restriction endonuclease McrBC regulatory subunit McrC
MLSREFPQQIDLLNVYDVKKLKGLRQFSEYDESLSAARNLYLDNCGKNEKLEKGNRVCGYAINMERSFENIVCYYSRMAARICGCRHKPQATRQLAASPRGEGYSYEVRPDDLISKDNSNLIMDAKYKAISAQDKYKKKPSRDDFYQMISSCIAYDCHEAVLIYPETIDFPAMTWSTDKLVNGFSIQVRAESINLSMDEDKLIGRLADIIKRTTFYEEVADG